MLIISSFQLTLAVIVISKCKIMQIVPSDARTYSRHILTPILVRDGGVGGGGGGGGGIWNPEPLFYAFLESFNLVHR